MVLVLRWICAITLWLIAVTGFYAGYQNYIERRVFNKGTEMRNIILYILVLIFFISGLLLVM